MKAKRTRNLIIMGVVLVLLIGVLVLIQIGNKKDKKDDGTDTVTYTEALTSFKESEISKVSYQYRDGEKLTTSRTALPSTWANISRKASRPRLP